MHFNATRLKNIAGKVPTSIKIVAGALAWLCFIAWLHVEMNLGHETRQVVKMGYMPVVTNLACPLLDRATIKGTGPKLEAIKFSSFADMGEALRSGSIDVAFMIAPLSIVLCQQKAGLAVVYIGNRHESTLVVRKNLDVRDFGDLAGKTLAVPIRYSGHYLAAMDLAEKYGIAGQVRIVEMNPPDMSAALSTGSLDAYFVGEPFAAQTVKGGQSRVLQYVEQTWPGFICNLMVMRKDFIEKNRFLTASLVQWAARAGLWAKNNPKQAAAIASSYWKQPRELVEYVLTTPPGRLVFDRFVPKQEEMRKLAGKMVHYGLIKTPDINGLVVDEFAKSADLEGVSDFASILKPLPYPPGKEVPRGGRKEKG